ncbi:hypothetical protein NQ166_08235 [Microbacterium sp. zg.Y1090]|uniref:hypothetical protein n=1 Tax=Microbacterium TaxID=33882 RepID=UPI00214B2E14|nr:MULTISPECIES: hypothetical protein [unclassified Microbacterium]MCR2811743.1 hypothetical protein [Microbacterium sp. zg.Y1084]MCR2818819.1 hypothetical protein [Microbacterium sp. zg.Y1090]MDL5486910.1 hypothetical protein [Microbacterium sp. zg-Y1211]WIM27133.1 hypothetical protein QNO26_08045 [Microbacterium sp. zg-Y1090]
MDDTQIRRHLTSVRRLILDIIATEGPVAPERIVTAWAAARSTASPRHRQALPRMAAETLWRLENLEWVAAGPDGYRLTPLGDHARRTGNFAR